MPDYSIEFILECEVLYHQGFSIRKIAQQKGVKSYCTISIWKKKYNWKKNSPKYPVISLKEQLDQCTDLVNKMRPEIDKVNILEPSKQDRELLLNYNRYSNLQIKLVRQLTGLKAIDNKPAKSNIFL